MAGRDAIIVFVKYPEESRVKNRLGSCIGGARAASLYRCFVEDELGTLARTGADLVIAYSPPERMADAASWLGGGYRYVPQSGGDLGERMRAAFIHVFGLGYERALLVGSDIPDLPGHIIEESFARLGESDVVIGPASDGGYYLIGFRSRSWEPRVFGDIPWSTETVLVHTTHRLRRAGRSFHLLPLWHDVDTVEDLARLVERIASGVSAAPRTAAYCAGNLSDILDLRAG